MRFLLFALSLIVVTCAFSKTVEDFVLEGIELLERSERSWFPLNVLYFYTGIYQLSKAVSLEPNNVAVRLARATILFRYIDNPYVIRVVKSDLEFLILYRELDEEFFSEHELDIYGMLCRVRAIMKDFDGYRACLLRLSRITGSERIVKDLTRRYGW